MVDESQSPGWRRARSGLIAAACIIGLVYYAARVDPLYPIADWLVWRIGLMWLYVLFFTVACVGVGRLVTVRVLRLEQMPLLESWLFAKVIGLAAFGLAMYLAGSVGALHPSFAIGMPALFIAGSVRELRQLLAFTLEELRNPPPETGFARVLRKTAIIWAALCFAALYAIGFTPDAISLDAAWYHFPVAQDYANSGRLIAFPSEYNKALPHLDSIVYCWGFLLPGVSRPFDWMLALHLEYAIVVWKCVGVAVGAQWMLGDVRTRGLWTVFFLSPMIFTYAHSITGGAEHFVGLWAVPMLIATGRMLPAFDLRYAVLLGIVSGGAILSKYQAIYMVVGCGSVIVGRWGWCLVQALRGRPVFPRTRLWLAPLAILGVGLGVASPHFLKNYVFYGDPLYPFLQAKLSGVHPTHDQADHLFHAKLGDPDNRPKLSGFKHITEPFRLFFDFTFTPHYVVVKEKWPVIGSLFTLLLAPLVFLRSTRRIWLGVWCAFATIAVWSHTYLQDRYLNAVSSVLLAVTAALLVRVWHAGTVARVALVPMVAFQVLWGSDAYVHSGKRLIEATLALARSGHEGRLDLAARYPYYRVFDRVNELTPEDAQVLVRGTRKTLGIDRYTHRDVQWHQANIWYEPLSNIAELWDHYRDVGVTHIVFKRHVHYAGNMLSTVLVDQLIVHGGGEHNRIHGTWEMSTLPAERPVADGPLEVLLLGVRPLYSDGFYEVGDLNLYGTSDKLRREGSGIPRERATTDAAKIAMLDRVDVVLIGEKRHPSKAVMAALEQQFKRFETVEKVEVYLRLNDAFTAWPPVERDPKDKDKDKEEVDPEDDPVDLVDPEEM